MSEPEDLREFRKRILGDDYEEDGEPRNLIDVQTLMSHAETAERLNLPTLGDIYVMYKPLRTVDRIEINKLQHSDPDVQRDMRNRRKVYLLLSRADKRYTEEVVDAMAAQLVDTILTEHLIQEEDGFLLPLLRRRSAGFRAPQQPSAA